MSALQPLHGLRRRRQTSSPVVLDVTFTSDSGTRYRAIGGGPTFADAIEFARASLPARTPGGSSTGPTSTEPDPDESRSTLRRVRTMGDVHESGSCSVAACAEIIGSKWTALLVHDLSEGPRRFTELEHSCTGISPRTLSERLRWLEDEGLVERHSYAESPPRVEYELTPKGEALLPIIDEMRRYGRDWLHVSPSATV